MIFDNFLEQISPFKDQSEVDRASSSEMLGVISHLFMSRNLTMDSLVKISRTIPDSVLRNIVSEMIEAQKNTIKKNPMFFNLIKISLTKVPKIISGDSFI